MRASGVKSAERAMELLEFFAEWRRPATVKEISQSLNYPQSSTSMLLRALADAGFYDHDARSGMYSPSVRILLVTEWIGTQLFAGQSLLRQMQRIHAATGHTVSVGVQHGIDVRYLHVLQGTRTDSLFAPIGSLRPLFGSASGKVLLTLKTEREISHLLQRVNARESDPQRKLELAAVLEERERTRRNGYAVSHGTSVPGASALSVLLPVPQGAKPMTLNVGAPIEVVERELDELLVLLRSVSVRLARLHSRFEAVGAGDPAMRRAARSAAADDSR